MSPYMNNNKKKIKNLEGKETRLFVISFLFVSYSSIEKGHYFSENMLRRELVVTTFHSS